MSMEQDFTAQCQIRDEARKYMNRMKHAMLSDYKRRQLDFFFLFFFFFNGISVTHRVITLCNIQTA